MGDIGCCGICARILLVCINLIYLLIGIGLTGFGIVFLIFSDYINALTDGNYIVPGLVMVGVGIVMFAMSIIGIIGAASNLWGLLVLYSMLLIIVMGLQMAGGVWLVTHTTFLENKMTDSFKTLISEYRSYTSSDYSSTVNGLVDFIQNEFQCCGVKSPWDWVNSTYVIKNFKLPDSCFCDDDDTSPNCFRLLSFPLVWKRGCNETFYDDFNNGFAGLAVTFISFSSFHILTLLLTISLCICVSQRKKRIRYVAYEPLEHSPLHNNTNNPSINDYRSISFRDTYQDNVTTNESHNSPQPNAPPQPPSSNY